MMSEKAIDEAIGKIDSTLAASPGDRPLNLGVELFAALVRRGLISDHAPAPVGGEGSEQEKSTYRDTHPAIVDVHLPDEAFAV